MSEKDRKRNKKEMNESAPNISESELRKLLNSNWEEEPVTREVVRYECKVHKRKHSPKIRCTPRMEKNHLTISVTLSDGSDEEKEKVMREIRRLQRNLTREIGKTSYVVIF